MTLRRGRARARARGCARSSCPTPTAAARATATTRATPTIRTGATCVLFYEYFHGDTGRGLGASHQTGWTALIAPCIEELARARNAPR